MRAAYGCVCRFEKSVGGLYLGELVRLTLLQLAEEGVVFGGQLPTSLRPPWTLTAAQITQIERSVFVAFPFPSSER